MKREKRKNRKSGVTISNRDFAKLLADHIHRAGEPQRPHFRSESLSLVGASGKVFRLGNVYDEYRLAPPSGRPALLRAWTRAWFAADLKLPGSYEAARSALRPVVRRRGTHECGLLEQRGGGMRAAPHRVFAGHFAVGLGYDRPECLAHVSEEGLSAWGVGLDEALEAAIDNLRADSRGGLVKAAPGLWVSPWHDSYDPARILLHGLIEGCEVRGQHVVMMPDENLLFVTGSEELDGLERMASLTEEAFIAPRVLSGLPLLLADGRWNPFQLPERHPLARRYRLLWHMTMARDYCRQGPLLAEAHARRGEDVFVATPLIKSDRATISSWAQGVVTSLPETQYVVFPGVGPDGARIIFHGAGEWDRVREVAGDLMEPLGLYPERYLVRSFPTPGQLEAIRGDGPDVLALLNQGPIP